MERATGGTKPLWLIGNGFHTALIFRTQDCPVLRGEFHGQPRADYVLFGWGNRTFYTGGKVNAFTVARATLLPDRSVLHVVPIRGSIRGTFPRSDLARFELPRQSHAAVCQYVDDALARDHCGQPIYVQPGYFPGSRFYQGRAIFFFPHLCNVWTARGLQKGGVPFFLPATLTADGLFSQASRSGLREQRRYRPVDGF